MKVFRVATLALCLAACGSDPAPVPEAAPAGQPVGWSDELELAALEDENPDPNVVEVSLEARIASVEVFPGTTTPVWTYNGALPGPLIRAKVGDTLVVHFENQLPEPTTIHWHGLRIPAAMDGVPEHSQTVVEPGGSFEYSFTLPDAGLYWYHPHHDSAAQVGNGLYGAILVDDPAEEPLGDELVLVLSDMALNEDGTFQPPDSSGELGTLFGREGAALLANGRVTPTLRARSGKLQRWRVVNTAKSRYFGLGLEGHSFRRIGVDGGLSEYPVDSEQVVLAPGERADLLVVLQGTPGNDVPVRWIAADRGFGSTVARPDLPLFYVSFDPEPASVTDKLPTTSRSIEPLDLTGIPPIEVALTQGVDAQGALVMGINGVPGDEAEPFHGTIGETQIWNVSTEMEFSHPFHLHGFFFQVLDEQGQPRRPLEWKDTVNVPYHGSTKLAVRYEDRPGMWMFHCHILDHADAGMMGMLHVMP